MLSMPHSAFSAGGIYASGGGTKTVGQTFTVTVTASGATFDTIHGAISVSGPVSVVSFNAGDATWISRPSNGGTFDGAFLGEKKTSFTVATIKLKGNSVGSGAVTISGASLKNAGSVVGNGSSNASFTIQKAPELPGAVQVSSSTHPDPNTAYEATTIALSWTKESGVDNFSYLLDQVADTTPPAKATDANTTISYADKAIGVYYFHIRAHKPDGWGNTTHFKITIKEPDAKINELLSKPSNIEIIKTGEFINTIKDGTVTGVLIKGKTEVGYTVLFTFKPELTLPEGKTMPEVIADSAGNFELLLDFPISSGYHTVVIQGQKEKVLTPLSDIVTFEISQANGGSINILTSEDEFAPVIANAEKNTKWYDRLNFKKYIAFFIGIGLIIFIALGFIIYRFSKNRKAKKLLKNMSKQITDNRIKSVKLP